MTITYGPLTRENFHPQSLDGFVRHQEVTKRWQMTAQGLVLVPEAFTEDWDLPKRREIAATIAEGVAGGKVAFGAFHWGSVVGYFFLDNQPIGTQRQYLELLLYHVSEPYRGRGIGKRLFALGSEAARNAGARKLYISAHPSQESQAAYRRLGCVDAVEIIPAIAEREPFDIQMEYALSPLGA